MGAKKKKGGKGKKGKKGGDTAKLMKAIAENPHEFMIKENIMETIALERMALVLEDFEEINTEKKEEFHGLLAKYRKENEDHLEAIYDINDVTDKLEKERAGEMEQIKEYNKTIAET